MVVIHFASRFRTRNKRAVWSIACGKAMEEDDRYIDDVESVDCADCMASEEFIASSLESALIDNDEGRESSATDWNHRSPKYPTSNYRPTHRKRERYSTR